MHTATVKRAGKLQHVTGKQGRTDLVILLETLEGRYTYASWKERNVLSLKTVSQQLVRL